MSQKRAAPLAPEARRASIVSAALPLLRQYGPNVTTAQIAMAAGVAEGTLFRVFPDKDAIVCAAIATAFDATPDERALAAIDRELSLREKLIAAVQIVQRRVERVWALISVLGPMAMPRPERKPPGKDDFHKDAGIRREIAALFALHADELRCAPEFAERILRLLAFAGGHPRINDGTNLTAEEVVAVVLDGVRARADLEDKQGPALPGRAALPKAVRR